MFHKVAQEMQDIKKCFFLLLSFKESKSCQETTVNFQTEKFIEFRLEFQRRNFDETLLKFRVCQKCYEISREI